MTKFTGWHTAREFAGMKLPGLPGTRQGVHLAAERDKWPSRKRDASGGGLEYSVAGLPEAARTAYWKQSSGTAVAALPATVSGTLQHLPVTSVAQLQDGQRETAEARLVLLNELERLAAGMGVTQAGLLLCQMACDPPADWPLVEVVKAANERANDARTLHIRSLYRWRKAYLLGGFLGLAPKYKPEDNTARWWHAPLLKLYGRPQKPSLVWAHAELVRTAPAGVKLPSYDQARRFLSKMSVLEVNKGRDGPSAMRARQPFVRRDVSKNLPGDIYVFDGHTFDAEISNRRNGGAFRPEITWGIDAATRLCVGFSVGQAESAMVVIDAVRHACEQYGPCAILYSDRGSGERNNAMGDRDLGIVARLGITQKFGKARNPQAHGIVEKAHQTLWVEGAREFDTFLNKSMDSDVKQKVHRITRRDMKLSGTSPLLMPFRQFVEWCQRRVDWYNNKPHRSLPRVVDANGVKRHMTPAEAWKRGMEMGAEVRPLKGDELDDSFRLYCFRKAPRGEISLFGNRYFHADLAHFDRSVKLRVGYDIHDPSKVWVRDPNGRLICIAKLDGNKRDFFPMSVVDQARATRAKGQLARLNMKAQAVRDELNPPALLEHQQAEVLELNINRIEAALAEPVLIEETVPEEVIAASRPMFSADYLKYEWLMANPDKVNGADEEWIAAFRTGDDWYSLYHDDEEQASNEKAAVAGGSNGGSFDAANVEASGLATSQPEREL